MKTRILRCMLAIAIAATAASAQQMNYQGRLTDNAGAPRPGPQATLTFSMWTLPTGGDKVWGDFALNADLIDGRFSVKLGTATGDDGNGNLLSTAFATNPGPRYLEIKVGTDAPLPRQQVLPAPTALHAVIAGTVPDGAIGTNQLANFAVTGAKIADNTIPVAKLTGAGANFWDGNGTNVWRTGGRVGIGTASPVTALHVLSAVSTEISVDSTAATGGKRYTLQSGNTGRFSIIDRDAGVSRFSVEANGNIGIVPTSGNVGIGTTSPNAKLDVAGNARISGDLTVTGTTTSSRDIVITGGNPTPGGTWDIRTTTLTNFTNRARGCKIRIYAQRTTAPYDIWNREGHLTMEQDNFVNNANFPGTYRQYYVRWLGGGAAVSGRWGHVTQPTKTNVRTLMGDGVVNIYDYIPNDLNGGSWQYWSDNLPRLYFAFHPDWAGQVIISDD